VQFFPAEFAVLAILAGLLAVDDRAGWQGLFAHPVFSATLVGAAFGNIYPGLAVGVSLELVWLSILPMRGTRRPDAVAGAIVGSGTMGLLLQNTGDPRTVLLVSIGVMVGLVAAEISAVLIRLAIKVRERWLENFVLPASASAERRKLGLYHIGSTLAIAVVEMAVVLVLLPFAFWAGDAFAVWANASVQEGARRWLELLPPFGAASMLVHYWQRHMNRFLILSAVVFYVILWVR